MLKTKHIHLKNINSLLHIAQTILFLLNSEFTSKDQLFVTICFLLQETLLMIGKMLNLTEISILNIYKYNNSNSISWELTITFLQYFIDQD